MTITSNKAAIASDLHLGVHQNDEKWLKEAYKFAEWFKKDIEAKGISDIIIPGDFFHDRTDINLLTLQYASKILNLWKDFHIWLIPGNHDCYHKDNASVTSVSIFRDQANITLMDETTTVYASGRRVVFVPWGVPMEAIPEGDVIVGHFELNGFKMNSFKVCEGHDEGINLLSKAPLVLTGHFHLRQEKRGKEGTILYVGTPYEMDYNDMGSEKGYHVIKFGHKSEDYAAKPEEVSLEFVLYPNTTKHRKISVSDLIANKDKLSEFLESQVRGNVVKFIVDKEVDFDKINALSQKILSYEPLAFRGVELTVEKKEEIKTESEQVSIQVEELIADFVKSLELDNAKDVLKLVLDLYNKYRSQ